MGPVDAEVLRFGEGIGAAFACDVVGIVDGKGTVESVPLFIAGGQARRPGSIGVDVAGQGQVEVVADYKGIAEVAQIQAAGIFLAVGRDQDAAGAVRPFRYEAEGDDKRNRDICNHGVGGAEHGPLLGLGHDLCRRHLQVVMRVLGVAHRVFSAGDVDGLVGHHLQFFTHELAFILLGGHVLDAGLAGFEIVEHLVHLILFSTGAHDRTSGHLASNGITCSLGVNDVELGVVGHVVGLQGHVLVCSGDVAEIIDDVVFNVLHHGVAGRGEGRAVDHAFGLGEKRVGREADRAVGEGGGVDGGGNGQRVGREYQRIGNGGVHQGVRLLGQTRHASGNQQKQGDHPSLAQGYGRYSIMEQNSYIC